MAQSIIGLLKDLEEIFIGPKVDRKKINTRVFDLLLQNYHTPESGEKWLISKVVNITYNLRSKKQYDKAASLELLIEAFLSKKKYPQQNFIVTKFDEHFSILNLLFNLEDAQNGGNLTEISWKSLDLLHKKTSSLKLQAPNDIFEFGTPKIFNFSDSKKPGLNLFSLDKGALTPADKSIHSTRFGGIDRKYPVFDFDAMNLCDLGSYTTQITVEDNKWFVEEQNQKDLLGAFQQLQSEKPENPFGINLKLPPLPQQSQSDNKFPFPASIKLKRSKEIIKKKLPSKINQWDMVTEELNSNENNFKYSMDTPDTRKMWEKAETYKISQALISLTTKKSDQDFIKSTDEIFDYQGTLISEEKLVIGLKYLLLGIPNGLFEMGSEFSLKTPFRLDCLNHKLTYNSIECLVRSGKQWINLVNFVEALKRKNELMSPAVASAIEKFLLFYQSFISNIPDTKTMIQLITETNSLREQLDSLNILCLNREFPRGGQLIDYLYEVTWANEGDFENSQLLKMIFKDVSKPFFEILTKFVFFGEIEDNYNEFIIQINKAYSSKPEFSVEKYYNRFSAQENILLKEAIEDLKNIGKNLSVLKLLIDDCFSYYHICATGLISSLDESDIKTPNFKLSFSPEKIKSLEDLFLAFQGQQTKALLELERKLLLEEERKKEAQLKEKLDKLKDRKNVANIAYQQEEEKNEAKKRKQWNYFQSLNNQINENRNLKRIEKEMEAQKEKERQAKLKEEQKELIEKGKQFLIEQHKKMLEEMYSKYGLNEWKTKRFALVKKRNEFLAKEEEKWKIEIADKMEIVEENGENREGNIAEMENQNEELKMDIEPIENANRQEEISFFPKRVLQPPGGFSSMKDIFNYHLVPDKAKKVQNIDQPRIGYREDLEKFEICASLLFEEIIKKVFRKITPRKKWAIAARNESSDIFKDILGDLPDDSSRSYPLSLIINKLIIQPIKLQSEFVNKATLHLILRKLKLMDHLKALKRYALLEAGDSIDQFLRSLFTDEYRGNTSSIWENSIKMSSCKDDPLAERFKIIDNKDGWLGMGYRNVDDLDYLSIKYSVDGILQLIVNEESIKSYSLVFITLLRVKYITMILSDFKFFFHTASTEISERLKVHLRRLQLLRQKMQHFLDIFQGYIASEVHGTAWKFLKSSIQKCKNLDELIDLHKQYLERVLLKCFLDLKGNVVMEQLRIIFGLVMRFQGIMKQIDSETGIDEEVIQKLKSVEQDFNRIHRFLYKMTKTISSKGNYPELFLRLDFNGYMEQQLEKDLARY
ncbi:TUBGCP6 [Blepharisma stoltei]|uniref:Gamma-tubulin complex component n=1 Tax=Blepharisma stoltei TaxID=1481888 RepID=A0AAU9JDI3_9CILI|nr:unnamed protein product [Blepharisma stoltei]